MRILYLISIMSVLAAVFLWLGTFKIIKKKVAFISALLLITIGAGLLLAAVLPQNNFYGTTISKVKTNDKVIALTFDDGPYNPYTKELLDVLTEKNVTATFFLVGDNIRENIEIVKLISKGNHEVALHADKHIDSLKLTADELEHNILAGKMLLKDITGTQIKYVRPPHGFRDWLVMDTIRKCDLTAVNWSVIPRDWTNPGAEVIADRVCSNAFAGAVVLLHDGDSPNNKASRDQTVKATSMIIDRLREEGYRFVTISELLTYEE